MNPIAAQQALKVASSLWGQFNKYRKDKAAQAYSALEEAASNVKDNADNFSDDVESRFPEARKQAGAVTKAAHDRVERALAEFNSRGEEAGERLASAASDLGNRAEKATRSSRKSAQKTLKKTRKNARKQANLSASSWRRPQIRSWTRNWASRSLSPSLSSPSLASSR